MSKEEKTVIEELEQLVEKCVDLREEEFYSVFTIHEVQNISTALNLMQKQQKEIETHIKANMIRTQKFNKELEKKDKIIDLMAKSFKQDDVRTVEEIKQYFEKKVEEEEC